MKAAVMARPVDARDIEPCQVCRFLTRRRTSIGARLVFYCGACAKLDDKPPIRQERADILPGMAREREREAAVQQTMSDLQGRNHA